MRVVRNKPSLNGLEKMLNGSDESLYLEGMDGLSRKEIVRYHSRMLAKGLEDEDFIVINDDGDSFLGMAIFHSLNWDTKLLQQNIAKIELVVTKSNIANKKDIYKRLFDEIIDICRTKRIKIIFFRSSIKDKALNRYLISRKIYPFSALINMYCSFDGKNKRNLKEKVEIQVRRPKRSECSELNDIMSKGFKNRLISEPLFRQKDVKKLYREWVKNDLKGRVKEVLIATTNGQIAGFVAFDRIDINNKKFGFIDILVVDRKFRKKGIGTALMDEAIRCLSKNAKGIFLGTELKNIEALNFYKALGFRAIDFNYTYHIRLDNRF